MVEAMVLEVENHAEEEEEGQQVKDNGIRTR